jgi:hypothetical protein
LIAFVLEARIIRIVIAPADDEWEVGQASDGSLVLLRQGTPEGLPEFLQVSSEDEERFEIAGVPGLAEAARPTTMQVAARRASLRANFDLPPTERPSASTPDMGKHD